VKALAIDYLIDAGPIVALLDRSDQWHTWTVPTLTSLGAARYATTETAIAEACYLLSTRRSAVLTVIQMVTSGFARVIPTLATEPARIAQLMDKYPSMDVGDATLVVLSEQHPRARLVTVDTKDFSIYRRQDGTLVPSIMPKV
jgi:hypothetical protein